MALAAEDLAAARRANIVRTLHEHPDWYRDLRKMVDWEQEHPQLLITGWQSIQVRVPPSVVSQMVYQDLVELVDKTRSRTTYRLQTPAAIKEALDVTNVRLLRPPLNVDELFDAVVGLDDVKKLLRICLQARRAVHVCLVGPPGVAKTVLLDDIARLDGAFSYAASNVTRSGLLGLLLAERPRYLILDEIDKMKSEDTNPLLGLMSNGQVTQLTHGSNQSIELDTKVFAAANDFMKLPAPIRSRFSTREVPAYSIKQFVEVTTRVLEIREEVPHDVALLIATVTARHSQDVRRAVDLARLSDGKAQLVLEMASVLWE